MNLSTYKIKIKSYNFALLLYAFVACMFFILVAKDSISSSTDDLYSTFSTLRLYADHSTYVNYFRQFRSNPLFFLLLKPNFSGPFLILYVVGENMNGIFIFNSLCLFLTVKIIYAWVPIRKLEYTVLLLVNPITFISLFSVNKEIISLLATNIFVIYLLNNSRKTFVLALIVGLIARKELSLLFFLYYVTTHVYNDWHRHMPRVIMVLLLGITFGGFIINSLFVSISEYATEAETIVGSSGSGGTILLLNNIQDQYGYIWVVIPKIALNLVGDALSRTQKLFNVENVYADVIIWGQSFIFLFITPLAIYNAWISNRFFNKKIFFTILLVCMVFSFIPVVQNRYFYVVYGLILVQLYSTD